MKKFIMTIAGAAAFLFATQVTAQEKSDMAVESNTEVKAPVETESQVEATVEAEAQDQKVFQPIETSELPDAVQEAVAVDFEGSAISEAYLNADKKIFKLVLQAEGTEDKTVFANAEGEWVKPKM